MCKWEVRMPVVIKFCQADSGTSKRPRMGQYYGIYLGFRINIPKITEKTASHLSTDSRQFKWQISKIPHAMLSLMRCDQCQCGEPHAVEATKDRCLFASSFDGLMENVDRVFPTKTHEILSSWLRRRVQDSKRPRMGQHDICRGLRINIPKITEKTASHLSTDKRQFKWRISKIPHTMPSPMRCDQLDYGEPSCCRSDQR